MSFLSAVRDRIASWSAALHGNAPFAPDLEADLPPAHRSPRSRIVIQSPRGLDQTEDVVDILRGNVFEVDLIDPAAAFHIVSHLRRGDEEIKGQGRIGSQNLGIGGFSGK